MRIKRSICVVAAVPTLFLSTAAAHVDRIIAATDGKDPDSCLSLEEITYAPGQGSPPHSHNATIIAYVIKGAVESKVDNEPVRTYRPGEHWVEQPGQQHRISRNASAAEPTSFLAIVLAHRGTKEAQSCERAGTSGSTDDGSK